MYVSTKILKYVNTLVFGYKFKNYNSYYQTFPIKIDIYICIFLFTYLSTYLYMYLGR